MRLKWGEDGYHEWNCPHSAPLVAFPCRKIIPFLHTCITAYNAKFFPCSRMYSPWDKVVREWGWNTLVAYRYTFSPLPFSIYHGVSIWKGRSLGPVLN